MFLSAIRRPLVAGLSAGGATLVARQWLVEPQSASLALSEASSPPPQRRFENKTVLITGAGGQLGRAGVLHFASEGANIVALDASAKGLEETKAALRESHPSARCLTCVTDVRSEESVTSAVSDAVRTFKRIDCCWNNAGVQGAMVPTADYPLSDFKLVLDVNVLGAFTVLQAVAKAMRDSAGGAGSDGGERNGGSGFSIVNTSSVAALRGTPTMVAYVTSKAAVLGMTMASAKDLAPYGIRVNAVSPALIGPGFMWDRQNELHAASGSPFFSRDPKAVAAGKVNSVPMRRLGSADEVVQTVAFLLSDDASYTTGTNSIIAGGLA